MSRADVPRVVLAAVAVVVLAWLALMVHNNRLQTSGGEVLRPGASAAQLARAEDDLKRARLLNPDTRPDLDLALIRRARGDTRSAIEGVTAVLRQEPDNLIAWRALEVLAQTTDPAAVARAQAAAARLDPLNARRARPASP